MSTEKKEEDKEKVFIDKNPLLGCKWNIPQTEQVIKRAVRYNSHRSIEQTTKDHQTE